MAALPDRCPAMTLPSNWKPVRVYGTYLRLDGMPNVGSVWFESASPVIATDDLGNPVMVVPKRIEAVLDDTGTFSVLLPATDDPDINPVGWTYTVREQIAGGRTFAIDVPVAMDEIDLITWAQATPVPTPPPMVSYLTSADIGVNVASQTDMDAAVAQAAQAAVDAAAATTTADNAAADASTALGVANDIAGTAQQALDTANDASAVATQAQADATTANNTANGIAATANTALTNANAAVTTANAAQATANGIDAKATLALTNANNAVTTANAATATANGIAATANTALTNANAAVTTANGAASDATAALTAAGNANTNANGRQPHDATLDALAALATAANQMIYTTAPDVFAMSALTAFGRSLVDDNDAVAARNTLGLGGSAVLPVGTGAATVAAGDDARIMRGGFKNKIINGNFDVWQRGTLVTAFTGGGVFVADRWKLAGAGTTVTASQQSHTPGQTVVPGGPTYFHRAVVASVAGANNFMILAHTVEGLEQFSGRTVTISFWAKADANKSIGFEIVKSYGTGGSTGESALNTTTMALTNAWQKFTYTFVVSSNNGKTVGPNSYLGVNFWIDCGSANTARGSIGQQSGTFDMSEVQLETGSVATEFEQRPLGLELVLCQRYYENNFEGVAPANGVVAGPVTMAHTYSANLMRAYPAFLVQKRAAPTVTIYSSNSGGSAGQWAVYNPSTAAYAGITVSALVTTTRGFDIQGGFTAAALGAYLSRILYTADAEL